jgi:short-subunit dehydrogenase
MLTAFIVTNACSLVAWVYFFGLNRTTIVRPYRGDRNPNLMFVANHQTPLDAFLIALAAHFPHTLWRPALHPWCLAAAEYWFRGRARAWLARHLRCIPVRRGQREISPLRRLCAVLPDGTTVFFPEGRRSPDGTILAGLPGAGYVAWRTHPQIVPVAVDGLLDAMPYENPRPRIGRRFRIAFGDPVECADLYERPEGRETAQAIVDRAMAAVRDLHAGLISDTSPTQTPVPSARCETRSLRGKVVWITGASSGIGRSLALLAHRAGATVILSARRAHQLETVAAECRGNADVHVVPLDLIDAAYLPHAVRRALAVTGHVDWVIHNAGIAARDLAVDLPVDIDRQVMETNYFGPVALTKAILPSMIRRRSGAIVVVSSVTGKYGVPRMSAYAASKHALHGFFDSLRSEVRDHNIQVTLAVPGFINTHITVNALTGNGRRYGKRMLVHVQGMEPDECASRILEGVVARKEEFLVGGVEIFTVWLLRISRRLVAALIRSHPYRIHEVVRKLVSFGTYRAREFKPRLGEDLPQMW